MRFPPKEKNTILPSLLKKAVSGETFPIFLYVVIIPHGALIAQCVCSELRQPEAAPQRSFRGKGSPPHRYQLVAARRNLTRDPRLTHDEDVLNLHDKADMLCEFWHLHYKRAQHAPLSSQSTAEPFSRNEHWKIDVNTSLEVDDL